MSPEAFRRWYESHNLTQTQVAGLLGIRQRRVSDMATGKSPVSRQTQRQLGLVEMLVRRLVPDMPVTDADRVYMVTVELDMEAERAVVLEAHFQAVESARRAP